MLHLRKFPEKIIDLHVILKVCIGLDLLDPVLDDICPKAAHDHRVDARVAIFVSDADQRHLHLGGLLKKKGQEMENAEGEKFALTLMQSVPNRGKKQTETDDPPLFICNARDVSRFHDDTQSVDQRLLRLLGEGDGAVQLAIRFVEKVSRR